MHVPQLMLCKPIQTDRWERRAIELAAYHHQHGHCSVPEVVLCQMTECLAISAAMYAVSKRHIPLLFHNSCGIIALFYSVLLHIDDITAAN